MNSIWSPEQQEIREWARKLSKELIQPHAERHSRNRIEKEYLLKLSGEGLMSLIVPDAMGGLGLNSSDFAIVVEEISKVCAATGVSIAVTNMVAETLLREGSKQQIEKAVLPLVRGEAATLSFCLSENHSGSDASALKTSASRSKDGYVLSGEKIYVTNGAFSDFFLVMARTGDDKTKGISAFLVSKDSKGVVFGKEEDKMGLAGSSTIRMSFDQVFVPDSDRVGAEGDGFKIAMRALDGGRISVSAQALGIGRAALEAGVRYAKSREAFGVPIADLQAIQWKIADSSMKLSAAELLIHRAASLKSRGLQHSREASQAKVFTTESATEVADAMIQVHGGYGYIKEYAAERYFRDVRVTMLYEGTSEIQRLVIARDLLKSFKGSHE